MLCQRTRLSRTSFNCGRASGSLSLSRRRRRRRRLPCCPPHPLIRSPLSPGWISPDARRRPYSPLPPLLSAGAPPFRRTSPSPPVVAPEEGHHQDLSCVLPRSAKEATPSGPGLFAQRRRAFQAVRMASTGRKSGRGALVVLEGLDRSGKSSQCARLLSYLKGQGCCAEGWRFPDRGTSVGQMISAYLANESQLDDRTVHLLFSANRWEKRALMESKLLGGTTLIVDRYTYSGVAFSAAKGLDIEWCKAPDVGLIAPDLVIYLDVQPERAAERGGYGGERYEKIEFQKRVADHYHSLCDSTWKVVDGSLPMETVEEQLRELATNCIRECQEKPLTTLTW